MLWEHELETIAEFAEMAEESALAELGAFGCIEFEDATSQAEFDEGECEPFWAFACDLYDEPRPYVALDLY